MPEGQTLATVLQPITKAVTDAVTISDVVTIIAAIVGAGILFSLVWFGGRKIVSALQSAITKGKIKM